MLAHRQPPPATEISGAAMSLTERYAKTLDEILDRVIGYFTSDQARV